MKEACRLSRIAETSPASAAPYISAKSSRFLSIADCALSFAFCILLFLASAGRRGWATHKIRVCRFIGAGRKTNSKTCCGVRRWSAKVTLAR